MLVALKPSDLHAWFLFLLMSQVLPIRSQRAGSQTQLFSDNNVHLQAFSYMLTWEDNIWQMGSGQNTPARVKIVFDAL